MHLITIIIFHLLLQVLLIIILIFVTTIETIYFNIMEFQLSSESTLRRTLTSSLGWKGCFIITIKMVIIIIITIKMVIMAMIIVDIIRYWETTPKKREKEAWKIYRTYICIGAPKELNLDMLSRKVMVINIAVMMYIVQSTYRVFFYWYPPKSSKYKKVILGEVRCI